MMNKSNSSNSIDADIDTIDRIFKQQVEKTPHCIALCSPGEGNSFISYKYLDEKTDALAFYLQQKGVGPESVVGVMVEKSIHMIIAILGILKAGGSWMPLPHDLPVQRLSLLLEDSQCKTVLTQKYIHEKNMVLPNVSKPIDIILIDQDSAYPFGKSPVSLAKSHNLAYVMHTSGTTGKPKGVMVEHHSLVNLVQWFGKTYGLGQGFHVIQLTDFRYDPIIEQVFGTLTNGAALYMPEKSMEADIALLRAFLEKYRISMMDYVPFMLEELSDGGDKIKHLHVLISGGEKLSDHQKNKIIAKGYRLFNHYGPTETTVDALSGEMTGSAVHLGKSIANAYCIIVDENIKEVPSGSPGELLVFGANVARGYLNNPSKTAESFITIEDVATHSGQGFRKNGGKVNYYRTGDKVRKLPDGNIEYLGRIDRQIKIFGVRIEPAEIEEQLKKVESVMAARVIKCDSGTSLSAYVIPKEDCIEASGDVFTIHTTAQFPMLTAEMEKLHVGAWPVFFSGANVNMNYWNRIYDNFSAFQLGLLDKDNRLAGVVNTIPLSWNGSNDDLPEGWDHAVLKGFKEQTKKIIPNTLCVLAGVVNPEIKNKGMSYLLIKAVKRLAASQGMKYLILPVRPTQKEVHPLMTLEDYCKMKREDGMFCDPWLRVHQRLGGKRLRLSLRSQIVKAPLAQWQAWAGREFTKSGDYIVKGAMQPVFIDMDANSGIYYDQAVWIRHNLDEPPLNATDESSIRNFLLKQLPAAMVPCRIIFLRGLPEENGADLFKINSGVIRNTYVAPDDYIERKLTQIIVDLLQCKNMKLGIDDRWLEPSYHSHKQEALIARIKKEFAVEIPFHMLVSPITVRELAVFIRKETAEGVHHIPNAGEKNYYSLSPQQLRYFFLNSVDGAGNSLILQRSVLMEGDVDCNRLESALQLLIGRHEVLRAAFFDCYGRPVQVIHTDVSIKLKFELREEEFAMDEETAISSFDLPPFDLTRPPLLHALLIQMEPKRHMLVVQAHAVIVDGESLDILIADLFRFYNGERPGPLSPCCLDILQWRMGLNGRNSTASKAAYWLQQYKVLPDALNLYTDFPGSGKYGFQFPQVDFRLTENVSSKIRNLNKENDTTAFMFVMTVLNLLFHKYTGREDLVIGTYASGRQHSEMQNVAGPFQHVTAIRNNPEPGKTIKTLLKEVKQNTVDVIENEDYTLELLLENLGVEIENHRFELFDVYLEELKPEPQLGGVDGLHLTFVEAPLPYRPVNIAVYFREKEDTFLFYFKYNGELFKKETVLHLVENFKILVETVVQSLDILVEKVKIPLNLCETRVNAYEDVVANLDFGF